MMDETKMTDELIMAYADGQLPDAEARKVERAALADPALQEKIRLFTDTARQLKAAAAELPPVPDALAQTISSILEKDAERSDHVEQDNVVQLPQQRWANQWPAALAASITLAIGVAAGAALGPFGGPQTEPPFGLAALADPEIAVTLSGAASGSSSVLGSGATLNVIASFVDADNTLCREFDYEAANGPSIVSVACRVNDTWRPKIAIAASHDLAGTFAPASSLEALETWLSTSGFGDALDPATEKQRLADVD
ncbi:MAG: hypothetical protein AAFN16_13070 [Pseudomonadota bacterium]